MAGKKCTHGWHVPIVPLFKASLSFRRTWCFRPQNVTSVLNLYEEFYLPRSTKNECTTLPPFSFFFFFNSKVDKILKIKFMLQEASKS